MKCELCEVKEATKIADELHLCTECYDGYMHDIMKVKPIKKENNETIPNNFRSSIGKVFGNNNNKEE